MYTKPQITWKKERWDVIINLKWGDGFGGYMVEPGMELT
jgi:hypothetical protein